MIDNSNHKQGALRSELPVRLLLRFTDKLLKKRMFAGYRDEVTVEKNPLLCALIIIIYRSSLSKTRPYYGFLWGLKSSFLFPYSLWPALCLLLYYMHFVCDCCFSVRITLLCLEGFQTLPWLLLACGLARAVAVHNRHSSLQQPRAGRRGNAGVAPATCSPRPPLACSGVKQGSEHKRLPQTKRDVLQSCSWFQLVLSQESNNDTRWRQRPHRGPPPATQQFTRVHRVLILVLLMYFQCAVDQFTGWVLTKGIIHFGTYLVHWFKVNFVFSLHVCADIYIY